MSQIVVPKGLPTRLAPFMHPNWLEEVDITTSWRTDIQASRDTIAEERTSIVSRPDRTVSFTSRSTDLTRTQRLLLNLAWHAEEGHPIPLVSDATTINAFSAANTLMCDTRKRRFFVGQRVFVGYFLQTPLAEEGEYSFITAIADDRLTVSPALLGSYTPNQASVYPMIDAELVFDSDAGMSSTRLADRTVRFIERRGPSALPPIIEDPAEISNFLPLIGGAPVLDFPINWNEDIDVGAIKDGSRYPSGRGAIINTSQERARLTFDATVTMQRDEFWNLLALNDYCKGRRRTFLMQNPMSPFPVPQSYSPAFIILEGMPSDPEVLEYYRQITRYVAFEVVDDGAYSEPTVLYAELAAYPSNIVPLNPPVNSLWALVAATAFPTLSVNHQIFYISPLHLCRFQQDAFTEKWTTTDVVQVTIRAQELINERTTELITA